MNPSPAGIAGNIKPTTMATKKKGPPKKQSVKQKRTHAKKLITENISHLPIKKVIPKALRIDIEAWKKRSEQDLVNIFYAHDAGLKRNPAEVGSENVKELGKALHIGQRSFNEISKVLAEATHKPGTPGRSGIVVTKENNEAFGVSYDGQLPIVEEVSTDPRRAYIPKHTAIMRFIPGIIFKPAAINMLKDLRLLPENLIYKSSSMVELPKDAKESAFLISKMLSMLTTREQNKVLAHIFQSQRQIRKAELTEKNLEVDFQDGKRGKAESAVHDLERIMMGTYEGDPL